MAKTSEPQALRVLWHQVLESTEQMLALGETHAIMLSAAALVLLTSLLIACAFREHCRPAAVQEYIYSRLPLLHQEDEEGQATSLWWERLSIAKELLMQLADITTDLSWSSSMLSKGHITFGILNILIIVVASVARFSMERLEWKQAGFNEDPEKFVQQQDVHGNRKPGAARLFAHLFQLNAFLDGWKLWRGTGVPVWSQNLVIEGVCEGIPSFILQVYAMLLLHEVETMSSWELARQLLSNALSLRAASVAIDRLNAGLDVHLPLALLLFRAADLGSRMLMIVLAAVVLRPPGGRLHEAHQSTFFFALVISSGLTFITAHVVNKKQPKTALLSSTLCCIFGTPYLSVPKGAYLHQQRRLRYLIVVLHSLEAILVNIAIWWRWGTGLLFGEAMLLAHLSHLLLWLVASCVLVADEASLRCLATPLLPTGREWEALEWASALGMATLVKKRILAEQGAQWSLCQIAAEEGQVCVLSVFEAQLSTMRNWPRETLVHVAASANQVSVLKYLQMPEVRADFSVKNMNGDTAAMIACHNGHAEVVKILHTDVRADFSVKNEKGFTAAMLACHNGHTEVVKILHTDVRADFSVKSEKGFTAAMLACLNGHAEVVKILHTDVRADFSVKDENGFTAAMLACQNGHTEVVKILHTDVRTDFSVKSKDGFTVAMLACQNGHAKVVKILHTDVRADFSVKTEKGVTAAMLACQNGHAEVVKILHTNVRADFSVKNEEGFTVAMLACLLGHAEVVKILHTDVRADFSVKTEKGVTAAMLACERGHAEVVKILHIYVRADFSVKDEDGFTAAMVACQNGHAEVVKILHTNVRADFSVKGENGFTAAMLACQSGHAEVVKILHSDVHADFSVQSEKGFTAAMLACYYGHAEVVKILHTEVRADFGVKTEEGWTAAMLACQNGHAEVVKILHTEVRADFSVQSEDGRTAAMLAAQQNRDEVVAYLQLHGLG